MNHIYALPAPTTRHATGAVTAVVVHLALGYALINGLGQKVIAALHEPLSVSLLETIRPEPPKPLPVPPKSIPRVAPTPYVPVPEVVPAAPAPAPITTQSHTPEPPQPAIATAAPAPVLAPVVAAVGVVCPNHVAVRSEVVYPARAQRLGLSGQVEVDFVVSSGGEVRQIEVVKSSNPVFNTTAVNAVGRLKCAGQGRDVHVRVPFVFNLEG